MFTLKGWGNENLVNFKASGSRAETGDVNRSGRLLANIYHVYLFLKAHRTYPCHGSIILPLKPFFFF